jgi:glycosyltransferase involved in cell wall biosynthesis
MNNSDSIVIIPTYNEKENIENIIRAVFALGKCFHILVIDDGSPDGTAAIVHRLIDTEFADRLFIKERSGKLGLGTAYIAGFKWALEHNYDYIFEMDADFSHDPNDLPRLYAACHDDGYDVAIGSRYVSGVNVVNWPIGTLLGIATHGSKPAERLSTQYLVGSIALCVLHGTPIGRRKEQHVVSTEYLCKVVIEVSSLVVVLKDKDRSKRTLLA